MKTWDDVARFTAQEGRQDSGIAIWYDGNEWGVRVWTPDRADDFTVRADTFDRLLPRILKAIAQHNEGEAQ